MRSILLLQKWDMPLPSIARTLYCDCQFKRRLPNIMPWPVVHIILRYNFYHMCNMMCSRLQVEPQIHCRIGVLLSWVRNSFILWTSGWHGTSISVRTSSLVALNIPSVSVTIHISNCGQFAACFAGGNENSNSIPTLPFPIPLSPFPFQSHFFLFNPTFAISIPLSPFLSHFLLFYPTLCVISHSFALSHLPLFLYRPKTDLNCYTSVTLSHIPTPTPYAHPLLSLFLFLTTTHFLYCWLTLPYDSLWFVSAMTPFHFWLTPVV